MSTFNFEQWQFCKAGGQCLCCCCSESWNILKNTYCCTWLITEWLCTFCFIRTDVDSDAWVVREFASSGMEFFVAMSFSKNFGLYSKFSNADCMKNYICCCCCSDERVGLLISVLKSPEMVTVVRSQLKALCRCLWSNPPNHGCRIVATVLGNPSLYQEWSV